MKLKSLFFVVLFSVFCLGFTSVRVYADEVTPTGEIATEETMETASADDTAEESQITGQDESALTTEAEDNSSETLENTDTNEEVIVEEAEEETVEEAEETVVKKETKKTTSKKTSTNKASTKKVSYSEEQLRLLAALIYCEAGSESYAGKLAVGIVVVNRKESSAFPDTIKSVIYQKYQFGPARNGALAKALKEYDAGKFTSKQEKDCIKAAKSALSDTKKITYKGKVINLKGYYYFSGRVQRYRIQIGNHQFK
ncbi:cell wall hydrolase [Anaeromicropila populeti]|uniref:Cell Wall Hydrolase n=1 Tax=Anaeromicropila populeti TaxID=37658 RepID=A0A1I6KQ57_9FIRM|nr:cell wall hydrolase [Anaeromicropila populeti]SFR93334.1 Cell Wall Hydrolase [Anaeromicropila populeti]